MKTTTLNKIKNFNPCLRSWKKLLKSLNKTRADDEELSFSHIYETLGTFDTIWCLRTLDDLKYCVRIATYAATRAYAAALNKAAVTMGDHLMLILEDEK